MGTRRSRHNKGRKPIYKEHRRGPSSDDLAARFNESESAEMAKRATERALEINKTKRPYLRVATGRTMKAGFNYLSDLIVRPGIEKRLWPLLLYRGNLGPGRAHRLWNMVLLMMASEAETLSDGLRLSNNPAFSQLCGPVVTPERRALFTFLGRLWDNPDTTDLIPGLTDYVKSLELGPSLLIPVDLETTKARCAPWRISLHPNPGQEPKERSIAPRFYPYIVHDADRPDDGTELIKLVNSAVPANLPDQWRADVCQELIIGILSGDISKGQVHDHVQKKIGQVFKMHSTKFEGGMLKLSTDAPMSEDDDRTLLDIEGDDPYWQEIETERSYDDVWAEADRNIARKDFHYKTMIERERFFGSFKSRHLPTQENDFYEKQIRDKQAELQANGKVLYRDDVIDLLEQDL